MKNNLKFLVVIIIAVIITFLVGNKLGWSKGYETGLVESKSAIDKSLELYNAAELKYILLARETASGKEARPEFVQEMWDIKARQDELLRDVLEYARKLGIDTKTIENIPLTE